MPAPTYRHCAQAPAPIHFLLRLSRIDAAWRAKSGQVGLAGQAMLATVLRLTS